MNRILLLLNFSYDTCLKLVLGITLLFLTLMLSAFSTNAQAPANDEPASAVALTLGAASAGNLTNATDSGYDYCFNGFNDEDDDVWYTFVAPTSGNIDVAFGNFTNKTEVLYVSILSGLSSTSDCVQDLDDTGGSVTGLTAGATYYAQVYSLNENAVTTTFDLTIAETVPPPVNNTCATATSVTPNGGAPAGTLAGATASGVSACGTHSGDEDDDVWFSFVPVATTQIIEVLRTGGSNPGLEYTVHSSTGACAGLAVVACSSNRSLTLTGLSLSTTYYIQVYSFLDGTETTTFTTRVVSEPANDDCANAIALADGSTLPGSTLGATKNDAGTGCDFGPGIWYSFTGTGGNVTISALQTDGVSDLAIGIVSGSCGSFTNVACVDDVIGVGNESLTFFTLADETYFAYIGNWNPAASEIVNFNVQLFEATLPDVAVSSGCSSASTLILDGDNEWEPIYAGATLVGKILDSEALGSTTVNLYGHTGGSLRTSGQPYADRNITISPTVAPSASISIRLYFTAAEIADLIAADPAISSIGDMRFAKVTGTSCSAAFSPGGGVQYLPITASGSFGSNHYIQTSVASFSEFYLTGVAGPLPVELISFEAFAKTTNEVVLRWQTASETNVEAFKVLRSVDGRTFVEVGAVSAKNQGEVLSAYQFTDRDVAGDLYYQLVTQDYDGSKQESQIVFVEAADQEAVHFRTYPNPTRDWMTLSTSQSGTFNLVDAMGRSVWEVELQSGERQVDLGHLPRGRYIGVMRTESSTEQSVIILQ